MKSSRPISLTRMGSVFVPEFTLTAKPFLGGYSRDFNGTTLTEATDVSITSIAQPLGGREALAKAVQSAWGCALPTPGKTVEADDGHRMFCTGPDRFLLTGPALGRSGRRCRQGTERGRLRHRSVRNLGDLAAVRTAGPPRAGTYLSGRPTPRRPARRGLRPHGDGASWGNRTGRRR